MYERCEMCGESFARFLQKAYWMIENGRWEIQAGVLLQYINFNLRQIKNNVKSGTRHMRKL